MAGHSKWANIKHRKGKADAAKGKIFSRLIKEIISSVKQGGPDPKTNSRLRIVIQKAKEANLPTDTVERNIKKASSSDQQDYEQVTYELYGHGGVGLIIDIMTDNKNRTASDMRIATNKRGGSIATPGAVLFNFDHKGVIHVLRDQMDEDSLFMLATEAGAEDFEASEEGYVITTAPDMLYQVKEKLDEAHIKCESVSLEYIPKLFIDCDAETKAANEALLEWIEALEDVDAVYHNMRLED